MLLRGVDPLGVRYLEDIGTILSKAESGKPYTLAPGVYHVKTFTFTITQERTRLVPDTSAIADCTVIAIGDSVTFGHGVNDQDTWVNLLALAFPQVHFINTGMLGYNSHAVRQTQAQWQADGFIYLVSANDSDPNLPSLERNLYYPYLSAYLIVLSSRNAYTPGELPSAYLADLEAIAQAAPTLFIHDVAYNEMNSYADAHPNAAGHRQIANAIMPQVNEAIRTWCNGKRTANSR